MCSRVARNSVTAAATDLIIVEFYFERATKPFYSKKHFRGNITTKADGNRQISSRHILKRDIRRDVTTKIIILLRYYLPERHVTVIRV